MSEFRSETLGVYGRPDSGPLRQLDLSPETLERLSHLKALKSRSTDLFLEESEAVLELNKRADVQQNGGIGAVVSAVLGYSKGYTSKRLTVGERLIAPLGLERVQSAGFGDTEVLYQAARAVEKGMAPLEALETFKGATREAAAMLNRGEDELIPIPGRYDANAVQIFMDGFRAAMTKGFTNTVMLERLGVLMRDADRVTLEQLSELMEVSA